MNTSSNIFKRMVYYLNPKHLQPKTVKLWTFWIILNIILFFTPNDVVYGSILMLVPIAAMFAYAIVTKDAFEGIIMGTFSLYLYWHKGNFILAFADATLNNLTDAENFAMFMSFLLCGGIIVMFSRSGVTQTFSDWVMKRFGSNEKLVLTSSAIFSGALSVDDYVASLTSGAAFSPLMDSMGKPRLALSFMIKTFSICISALLPFGAWGYFIIYQIAAAESVGSLGEASKMFMKTIPYQIFPIVACVIALLFGLGLFPKIGHMKKAYEAAEKGIQLGAEEDGAEEAEEISEMVANDPRKQHVSLLNLVLPILFLVWALFRFEFDGWLSFLTTLLFTGALYVLQGIFSIREFIGCVIEGCEDMIDMSIILLHGYAIQVVLYEMGFEEFIAGFCDLIPIVSLIPFVFFVYFSLQEFLCTMNYSLYLILFPIMISIIPEMGGNIYLVLGAIISAGVFGGNVCVISDCGVLAAKSCRVSIYDQFIASQPYYWISYVITAAIYLVLGFVL